MDYAKCIADQHVYSIEEFKNLVVNDLQEKRRLLVCPECEGPAFFRRASQGREACFGARPHYSGCSLSTSNYAHTITMSNHSGIENIVVDFNYGYVHERETSNDIDVQNYIQDDRGISILRNNSNNSVRRRLSSILKLLVEDQNFSNSSILLSFPECDILAKDFFIDFHSVDSKIDDVRGLWGMLSDARYDEQNNLWLNSGYKDNISFLIKSHLVHELYSRFKITDTEDIAGAYALIIGGAKYSTNGKLYSIIEYIDNICLRLY